MDFDDRSCTIIDRLQGRFVDRVRIGRRTDLGVWISSDDEVFGRIRNVVFVQFV
jgi:hypothetical protein